MITHPFIKFGPGIRCFEVGTEGCWVNLEDGSRRPMTEQECEWVFDAPMDDIDQLQALNSDEAGAECCEYCGKFHPVLRHYKDWHHLCPSCVADGEDYYESMYRDCCSYY